MPATGIIGPIRDKGADVVPSTPLEQVREYIRASKADNAAALAIAEFRRCGLTANAPRPATRLTVAVKVSATSHEVRLSKIEAWLESGGGVRTNRQ